MSPSTSARRSSSGPDRSRYLFAMKAATAVITRIASSVIPSGAPAEATVTVDVAATGTALGAV